MSNIRFRILSMRPDRSQYKQYGVVLQPVDMVDVVVPVDDEHITIVQDEFRAEVIELSIEGLAQLVGKIADAIEVDHDRYLKEKFDGNKD